MYHGLKIAVVIPAFNEQRHIGAVVRNVPPFVDTLVLVDDGSTDGTLAEALGTGDARLVTIRNTENRGVGAAIVAGYRKALALELDVAVVMAGDGQMDPADLPALLDPVVGGRTDYAKGNRLFHPDTPRAMPLWRFLGNSALSLLTRRSSGYPGIVDSQCGYTALRLARIRGLDLGSLFPRYGFPNDFLALLHSAGLRVENIPVRPVYEGQKSGIRPFPAIITVSYVLGRSYILRRQRERSSSGGGE